MAAASSRRSLRLVGLAWGPLVSLSTVATANHFVIDLAAGLAVTGLGLGVALVLARYPALIPGRRSAEFMSSRTAIGGH